MRGLPAAIRMHLDCTHMRPVLVRLAMAIALACVALLGHGATAPLLHADPTNVWVVNENVATTLLGAGFACTPGGADAAAAQLDAIAAASAAQVSYDPTHAGNACVIVQTDGSITSVSLNGRGLTLGAVDGPVSGVNGTFAAAEVIGPGTFVSGNTITAIQDSVALDSAPLTVVTAAHDIMVSVSKDTVQAGAPSCVIAANQTAPTNGLATATYTDLDGEPLVGYTPTFATSGISVLVVGNTSGQTDGGASQTLVTMANADATIGAEDAYCGVNPGTVTLSASTAAGEISGVPGIFTRTAQVTVTGVPASLTLLASPAAVVCNGTNTSTVVATVMDSAGNRVVDGTPVTFSVVSEGTANPVTTVTRGGDASSIIKPLANVTTGVVVTVTTGSVSQQITIGCQQPAGPDFFADPYVMTSLPVTGLPLDTTGFTTEASEPVPCGSMGATAWFVVTFPVGSIAVTVDTAGSSFNTALAVYQSQPTSPPGGLSEVGCNASGTDSSVSFPVSAPGTYYFQAGGQGGATGLLSLDITCANDSDCDGLTNTDEATLGTNPDMSDTDGDGLSDGLEVRIYGTNPLKSDTDGDGCGDGSELGSIPGLGGLRDPLDPWDFYDVPSPALRLGYTGQTLDHGIGVTTDVLALLAYSGIDSTGPDYTADRDDNGIADGRQYDRSLSTVGGEPWRSGPPDGAIGVTTDVLAMLEQSGSSCS